MLPPVVEIVSPLGGADVTSLNISVRYVVRSPSGETMTDLKILVDGRPASGERGARLGAAKWRSATPVFDPWSAARVC
jgi:hypothetical protein